MFRFAKLFAWLVAIMILVLAIIWLANASMFVSDTEGHQTRLIAHRGVHQIYAGQDRSNDACHASPIEPVSHQFIENTISSINEAFRLGADIVELDVHLTTDNIFAVFHDWTLDCRTDGSGVTHEHSFEDLKKLDISYKLDDGSGTYPFQGAGIGAIPSLQDVLEKKRDGQLLINFKSNRKIEGTNLATLLQNSPKLDDVYGVYGGSAPTEEAQNLIPDLRGFTKASIKSCIIDYALKGWFGIAPESCHKTTLMVPQNIGPYLWGWPHRFTKRLKEHGTDVILVGDYDGSRFSSGIDSLKDLTRVPENFDGYIWTNKIEIIGPELTTN